MESVGPSFRKKQIGNTQPRRYIPRLLKVLSQSLNYFAGVFKIDNRQNTIPFPLIKIDAAHAPLSWEYWT